MTTTDHDEKTTPTEEPTTDVDGRDHRLMNAGNIATAVAGLGLSIVCGTVLPLPIDRTLVGIAAVVAVVAAGVWLYRKFGEGYEADVAAMKKRLEGRTAEKRKPKHTS